MLKQSPRSFGDGGDNIIDDGYDTVRFEPSCDCHAKGATQVAMPCRSTGSGLLQFVPGRADQVMANRNLQGAGKPVLDLQRLVKTTFAQADTVQRQRHQQVGQKSPRVLMLYIGAC